MIYDENCFILFKKINTRNLKKSVQKTNCNKMNTNTLTNRPNITLETRRSNVHLWQAVVRDVYIITQIPHDGNNKWGQWGLYFLIKYRLWLTVIIHINPKSDNMHCHPQNVIFISKKSHIVMQI